MHGMHILPNTDQAFNMFLALSVTPYMHLSVMPHSLKQAVKRSAKLSAVCEISSGLVCSTAEAKFHSALMKWMVTVKECYG